MCGFGGFVDGVKGAVRSTTIERFCPTVTLERMGAALVHRGPDDGGIWFDPDARIGLSHRRLSIVDLSAAGHQPMHSESGRFVIAFNGEIYNHLALRDALDRSGARTAWRGHSDTETLLAGFEAWGIERTLAACVGMFSIALWNRNERTLHLMRDRMGEKPLYYGWAGSSFVFGSELKALRAHPSWTGAIDRDAMSLLFRHNYIPAPYSIYQGVRKLPGGTVLNLSIGTLRDRLLPEPAPYWSVSEAANHGYAEPFEGSDAEALAKLESLCVDAISLQQVADVPLGAFLSGGIDSSVVAALMQAQNSSPIRTFTIGFKEGAYNEADFALAVARHLGTHHTELYVSPEEAQAVIPRLPAIYDEPFSDTSQIPTFLVSQLARRDVTVSLSGDGGDELFGGYNRYFLGRGLHRKLTRVPLLLRELGARAIARMSPGFLDRIARPLGRLVPQLNVAQPSDKIYKALEVVTLARDTDLYRHLVSHWTDPASLVIGGREPPTTLDAALFERRKDESFEQWMMTTDLRTYLPDDILVKVDRAAMAVSLETRVPFLDHRLVEFSLSLPLHLKLRDGQGKWLLRQLLDKHVPKALIDRPKMGFGVPIDSWLRGPLRDWAEPLLDESRLRREGFLNPAAIRGKWADHVSGARNWQYHLWDVLMFQAWLEAEKAGVSEPRES